ncbi:MAG: PAS domain-containing protein [Myxacorys chilensis ATA2-1-KO14]|jgi:signal transduction histidine kinase|nr:PAS domain-containing protein [Myxacorys chilensis ATA2-1-KO14]
MRSTQQALRVSGTQTLPHPSHSLPSYDSVELPKATSVDSTTALRWTEPIVQCEVSDHLCTGLEQSWLASLVHSSPDLIGTVSFDGQWLFMNQAGQDLLGLHGLESSHRITLDETVDETDRDRLADLLLTALQDGHWQGHLRFRQAATETAIATSSQWFVVCDLYTHQPLCLATISRAVQDSDWNTDGLLEDNHSALHLPSLNTETLTEAEALTDEKTLNHLKSQFLAEICHELRSPLTVIASSAGILEAMNDCSQLSEANCSDRAKTQKHFQRIQNKVRQMTQLIDDILLLSRIQQNHPALQPVTTDIIQVCTELIEEVQLSTSHEITFSPRDQEHFYIQKFNAEVDIVLLQRILVNLLSNSIKYSPGGTKISIDLYCQSNSLLFQIQDQGIGIPLGDQQHLFNSFYRASNTEKVSGTGLGLAIVKRCVEIYGGSISLISETGTGTMVTVKIPIRES